MRLTASFWQPPTQEMRRLPYSGEDLEDAEIAGLALDSRQVGPGYLFAALPGSRVDGREYIDQAIDRGAVAVLARRTYRPARLRPPGRAADRRQSAPPPRPAGRRAFYGRQPATVVAVTGTNGKTSVAEFARQLWADAGQRAASLGTLGLVPAEALDEQPPALTTPDPVALMRSLAALAAAGYEEVALEASSHGLDQYRLDGLALSAAAFTNLTRDHLDYHGTLEAYFAAKRRLFEELLPSGAVAVINADAPQAPELAAIARARGHRLIAFGIAETADLRLLARRPTAEGQQLLLTVAGRRAEITLPLLGEFQAFNVLAAMGLAIGCGMAAEQALDAAAPSSRGVPGRLEFVGRTPAGGGSMSTTPTSPAALETVLRTLRPHARGRLWVVFGCGGDRDRAKRPLMGELAQRLADQAVITDDNPRSEDPAAIRAAMLAAAPQALEIGDRRAAIATAMLGLGAGDLLVIAGKGHESGQTVGAQVLPFDDRQVAREIAQQMAAP